MTKLTKAQENTLRVIANLPGQEAWHYIARQAEGLNSKSIPALVRAGLLEEFEVGEDQAMPWGDSRKVRLTTEGSAFLAERPGLR